MKKHTELILIILAWVAVVPTVLWGQTGACFVEVAESEIAEEPDASFCVEEVTETECDEFAPGEFEWEEGQLCLNSLYSWEGACMVPDFENIGDICVFVDTDTPEASMDACLGTLPEESYWFAKSENGYNERPVCWVAVP